MNRSSFARACALVPAYAALRPLSAFAQATPALTPIRIANLGFTDASALPIYAQQSGIFKKYGLDATVTTFNGGGRNHRRNRRRIARRRVSRISRRPSQLFNAAFRS